MFIVFFIPFVWGGTWGGGVYKRANATRGRAQSDAGLMGNVGRGTEEREAHIWAERRTATRGASRRAEAPAAGGEGVRGPPPGRVGDRMSCGGGGGRAPAAVLGD